MKNMFNYNTNTSLEIAKQLPQFIIDLGDENLLSKKLELGESLEMFLLKREISSDKIDDLLLQINRWHHQVYSDENVCGYAESVVVKSEKEDWQVVSYTHSLDTSFAINKAIEIADSKNPDSEFSRLIRSYSRQLIVLWFGNEKTSFFIPCVLPNREDQHLFKTYSLKEFISFIGNLKIIEGKKTI
jgi:hypothetical protein